MATTGISLIREQTVAMRLPRFLWVPFELGRPFGAPNEPDFQRRVLHDALALFERDSGPPVLADFPDDAPHSVEEAVWACPVSFGPTTEDADLAAATIAEMTRLAPWLEGTRELVANSAMTREEMVATLGRAADPDAMPDSVEVIRLAADDLRTWYLHAAAHQPGRASAADRQRWFWEDTALARLLGTVVMRLRDEDDPLLRMFAERAVVPRDHLARLAPPPERPHTGEHDE